MLKRWIVASLAVALTVASITAQADASSPADPQAAQPTPAAPPTPSACTSTQEFLATDCPLTWHGITLYGAYDVGFGWVSHGMPTNGHNYEGESLVNRNGNRSRYLIEPNNLQQTGVGIRAKEKIVEGWAVVFNASTGFNPQSFEIANLAATNTINNGPPGKIIRLPETARARAKRSTTKSTVGYRRRISAHSHLVVSARSVPMRCSNTTLPAAPTPFRSSAITA
jgi:hypothetical protein